MSDSLVSGQNDSSRRAWLQLVIFCCIQAEAALQWAVYPAVATLMQSSFSEFSSLGASTADGLTNVFYFLFPPALFISSFFLDSKGLLPALRFAICGMALASVLRYIVFWLCLQNSLNRTTSYWLLLAIQGTVALIQPTAYNAPSKFTVEWFPPKWHNTATTLAVVSSGAGVSVGYALGSLTSSESCSAGDFRNMPLYMLVHASISVFVCLIGLIGLRSPPHVNSVAAYSSFTAAVLSVRKSGAVLWWCVSAFSCMFGVLNIFGTIINAQAALTGSVSAATSCCLAVVVGWTVDRGYWKVLHLADRRSVCTVLSLLAALWTLGFDFLLSTRSVVLSSLMIGLQGCCLSSLFSLLLNCAAAAGVKNRQHPVAEGTSAGLCLVVGNLLSFVGMIFFSTNILSIFEWLLCHSMVLCALLNFKLDKDPYVTESEDTTSGLLSSP